VAVPMQPSAATAGSHAMATVRPPSSPQPHAADLLQPHRYVLPALSSSSHQPVGPQHPVEKGGRGKRSACQQAPSHDAQFR